MKKMIVQTLSVFGFGFLALIASCNRPECKNTNAIFEEYSADTKEYKDELVNQLAKVDKSKLTYWMEAYQENNRSKYLLAQIQGEGLCAKIVLEVRDSEKGIEGIIENKGRGYSGAELQNLKFHVIQDSASTTFIFQEISGIVD